MAYNDIWRLRIQNRINDLEIREEFVLRDLMEDLWDQICVDQREQDVGSAFSRDVERGAIIGVEFSRIRRGPRATVWRRIER